MVTATVEPKLCDAAATSDEGPFFVARGSVCLTSESSVEPAYAAASRSILAVAGSVGLSFFSDSSGVPPTALPDPSTLDMLLIMIANTSVEDWSEQA